jgi:transposase
VGRKRLRSVTLAEGDRWLVELKVEELALLQRQQAEVEQRMQAVYDQWPEAQRLDAIRGIGMVTAVTMLAHIGPVERFATAEDLISYAGLAPAVRSSDQTCRNGKIGGGGTDRLLRYLVIEASTWLKQVPRYRATYERAWARRGKKIARIVLARLLLRSVHTMLRDGVRFNPAPRPRQVSPTFTRRSAVASSP